MLRELLEPSALADFVRGFARLADVGAAAYDSRGLRLTYATVRGGRALPESVALPKVFVRTGGGRQSIGVAFLDVNRVRRALAEVRAVRGLAGYLLIGDFEPAERVAHDPHERVDAERPVRRARRPSVRGSAVAARPEGAISRLLARDPYDPWIDTLRWGARQLSLLCAEEQRLSTVSQELSLLGDLGELLSDERDVQKILDRIVYETSRVTQCQYASLRLFDPRTRELRLAAAYNMSEAFRDIPSVPLDENPIDQLALTGEIVYTGDAQKDMRIPYRTQVAQLGVRSGLTAGLIYRGRPIGVLRVYADRVRTFRGPHRDLLRAVAAQAATAIVNTNLVRERLRAANLERQIELAGAVQSRMLRLAPPEHPHLDTARVVDPSSHVGGDFCDLFRMKDGRLLAIVGDVVGHGLPAALLMASVRGAIRSAADYTSDLAEMVNHLNKHLALTTESNEFVTMTAVAVAPDASYVEYCSCGHEALALLRHGELLQAEEGGLVLGVDVGERYEVHRLDLRPGDFIFLFTDGAFEAMNFAGELFGRRRLLKAVKRYGGEHPDACLKAIHWDIRRFAGMAERTDDITMVGLRVR